MTKDHPPKSILSKVPKNISNKQLCLTTFFVLSIFSSYYFYPGVNESAVYKDDFIYKIVFLFLGQTFQISAHFLTNLFGFGYEKIHRFSMDLPEEIYLKFANTKEMKLKVNEFEHPKGHFKIIQSLPYELARNDVEKRPTIFYIHGGGMVGGSPKMMTLAVSNATRYQVLGISYRLAPESPFPGPVNDVVEALRFAFTVDQQKFKIGKFAIFGESAGGHLTISSSFVIDYEQEFGRKPELILPVVPMTQMLRFDTPSYLAKKNGGFLSKDLMIKFWLSFAGFDSYDLASQEILGRNFHWSENIRSDREFYERADPEVLGLTKKHNKYTPLKRNKYSFHNPLPQNFEHLLRHELFCPGLADEIFLKNFLQNSKNIAILTAENDVLSNDGKMFYKRLSETKIGREKIDKKELIFEEFSGAQHIFYMSSKKMNPVLGFDFYDDYTDRIVGLLSNALR